MTTCQQCSKAFEPAYKGRVTRFCSPRCRTASYKPKRLYGGSQGLSSGTQGALAELVAAVNLTRRGYEVFRAIGPHASCDLLALKGEAVLRIEVRTGYKTLGGELRHPKPERDRGRQDVYAVVFEDSVTYIPPID